MLDKILWTVYSGTFQDKNDIFTLIIIHIAL